MQAQKQGEICELAWSNRTGRLRIENAAKHTQNRKHIVRPGREPGNDKRIRKVDNDCVRVPHGPNGPVNLPARGGK